MKVPYKTLVSEIARRGIKKKAIAKEIGISERAFYNKLNGDVSFTWEEVCGISKCFFPDMTKDELMKRSEEESETEKDTA